MQSQQDNAALPIQELKRQQILTLADMGVIWEQQEELNGQIEQIKEKQSNLETLKIQKRQALHDILQAMQKAAPEMETSPPGAGPDPVA